MSDKKRKKSKRGRTIGTVYGSRVAIHLAIALAVTIGGLIIAMPYGTELVHKIERAFPQSSGDVVLSDKPVALGEAYYGAKVGAISSEAFGLNCDIYFGANRASMRNGAGLSGVKGAFDGFTYISGYAESFFAPLHYAEKGDVITVTTSDFTADYRVADIFYTKKGEAEYSGNEKNVIMLCAKESDLSKHSGEDFCVVAVAVEEVG